MLNIKEHYQEILSSIHFDFEEFVIEDASKGRLLIKGKFHDVPALIKIYNKNADISARVDKEFNVDKLISDYNQNNPKKMILKTDVIQKGEINNFIWIIRKYYNGASLADPRGKLEDLNVLFNHDLIREKFLGEREKILGQVINYLNNIRRISIDLLNSSPLSLDQVKPRYNIDITKNPIQELEDQFQFSLLNQIKFYQETRGCFLLSQNLVASAGDLLPSNIIVDLNLEVRFSDLELFCFDNRLTDTAYLWLFLWRYLDWQEYLIDYLVKSAEDKDFFRAVIIKTVISNGGWFKRLPGNENQNGHAWVKYLKAAGESFEAIMKVK